VEKKEVGRRTTWGQVRRNKGCGEGVVGDSVNNAKKATWGAMIGGERMSIGIKFTCRGGRKKRSFFEGGRKAALVMEGRELGQ